MSIINKLDLIIIFMGIFVAKGLCCTDEEWTCASGECIDLDKLCDGNSECLDGSDETADVCIKQMCPSFAFQCAYGACVPGSAKCNGIKDCVDYSDETSSLCKKIK